MKKSIPSHSKIFFPAALFAILFFAFGKNAGAQSCIGEQGKIEWMLYENLLRWEMERLYTAPKFPQTPDYIEEMNNLGRPSDTYNDRYGSLIRCFIQAPETGQYRFNLTGDDYCFFSMSLDTFPENASLRANIPVWTGQDEHDKYPEQTTDLIQLTAGEYYYIELIQREGGGGDHIQLYWKRPSEINLPDWHLITGDYVYDYACDIICEAAGTPCDDGDPTTTDDQWDGNCGCLGMPAVLPFACIGERGSLLALRYEGITGTYVQDMYDAPNYPAAPDSADVLPNFSQPVSIEKDNFGTRVRGYLRAPATGKYIFNVTGVNEVRLMLSANETTTVADEIAFNDRWTDDFDFTDSPEQTSDSIDLVAGQFYAIELVHKDNTSGDDFHVFWKTPVSRDTFWHVIDGSYLYQYGCESACIPEGTPCNDGNPDTFDDQYDSACNCTGTPCADPECSNALNYTPYEACEENTGNHSTNPNSSWLSCEPQESPNPERGLTHWIQYDFGGIFALDDADIWNYNAAGASAQGFQEVVIDYSLDGSNWSELGTFNWAQAPGTSEYGGFNMDEFAGISARYILITAISNFDNSGCVGLSEISFNATTCPDAGTACDDGNPNTENDAYNEFCYCLGTPVADNDCDEVAMIRNERPVPSKFYNAELTITSSGLIKVGSNVTYVAGESITLEAGFEVEYGAEFYAYIAPCSPPPPDLLRQMKREEKRELRRAEKEAEKAQRQQAKLNELNLEKYPPGEIWLRLSPNPTSTTSLAEYNLPLSEKIRLGVFDASGKLVIWLADGQFYEEGIYQKTITVGGLSSGKYLVSLFSGNGVVSEWLVVE